MTLGSSCNFNRNSGGLSLTAQGTQEKDGHARSLDTMSVYRGSHGGEAQFHRH